MVREPPPWRNDAALLSKIASQEKLRAELPSPLSRVLLLLLLFLFRNTLSLSERPLGFSPTGIDTMAPGIRRILR